MKEVQDQVSDLQIERLEDFERVKFLVVWMFSRAWFDDGLVMQRTLS